MAQGKVKMLCPPLTLDKDDGKSKLLEDRRYARWSKQQVRAMRNGTYDWASHSERPLRGI